MEEFKFAVLPMFGFASNILDEMDETYKATEKSVVFDESCRNVVDKIMHKRASLIKHGFEPEFLLMNQKNYERLVAYICHCGGDYVSNTPDEFAGMKIVIWDVPVDFLNIRCKASDEWAYGEALVDMRKRNE